MEKKKKKRKVFREILLTLAVVLIPAVLVIVSRIFFWDMFVVPSDSMYPTLQKGDHVIINKTIFGARLYKDYESLFADKPSISRVLHSRELERGDIIIFNYPYAVEWGRIAFDFNILYVKRCVGLPGDSVYAERGVIQVKGVEGTVGIPSNQQQLAQIDMELLPREQRETFAPDSLWGKWTIRDFGPIYVPKKGDRIPIDADNLAMYRQVIAFETGIRPAVNENGESVLGNESLSEYTFQGNWYFAAGDNTMASLDSRYWGFVPEDFIAGVVTRVAYSYDQNRKKFHWDRFFKSVKIKI